MATKMLSGLADGEVAYQTRRYVVEAFGSRVLFFNISPNDSMPVGYLAAFRVQELSDREVDPVEPGTAMHLLADSFLRVGPAPVPGNNSGIGW